MALSRPLTLEDLLCELDINRAGGAIHVIEHLLEDGLSTVISILDEEEVGEDEIETLKMNSEDEDDWSDQESEDSWYESITEDEEDPVQPVGCPEGLLPVSPWSEDSAPPASGLSSSTKRSREESDTLQVSVKRQTKTCEDSHEEPTPSTSGLSSSTYRGYWQSPFGYDDSDSDEDLQPWLGNLCVLKDS